MHCANAFEWLCTSRLEQEFEALRLSLRFSLLSLSSAHSAYLPVSDCLIQTV
jgi:hypothetical protein